MSAATSIERIIDAARARGLKVRHLHSDDYMVQCPVHGPDNNPSVHVTYRPGEGCTLICDQHDAADKHLTLEILQALKLDWPDLYDNPRTRDAARKAYSRRWGRLTREELRALADATERRERKPDAQEREAVGVETFTPPAPYVPESARGAFSDTFRAICARLGIQPAYGPFKAACPVCGEVDVLRVLYAPLQHAVLFRCRSCGGGGDYAARLASALQISPACVGSNGMEVMAYDDPHGVVYEYADGLMVSRSPSKQVRQHGRTRGRHPLWLAKQVAEYARAGIPVFLVEGEKDAATLWACGYAATTAAGGGGNLKRTLDLDGVKAVFSGATVMAVVDKDATGGVWRSQVAALLLPVVKSLTFVQATGEAHDTTDAVMMRERFESLPAVTAGPAASAAPVDGDIPDEDTGDDGADVERFERFWLETPYLTRIRDAARQSLASPWGVFMALLARVGTVLPPHVVVPAFVGASPASLNVFVALVGPSGMGKGAAESVAAALLPDIRDAVTSQPGSGEGLVTMFCERVADESGDKDGEGPRTVLRCANRRALLSVPEVSTLGAVMGRQGSTLAGELTKAWSGEPLGSRTKYAAGTFRAPRHGYRLCLVTGVQEGNAGVLFNEADTGLPQRFLWADTRDDERHAITYERWERYDVTPLAGNASRFPHDNEKIQVLYMQGDRWNMIDHGEKTYPLVEVQYPETARRTTFEERRHNLVGEAGDRLDAHGNLVRLKVAALLPWLDPDRTDPLTVTDEDWRLAGEVMAYSQSVRRRCLEAEHSRRVETAADYAKLKKAANREAEDEQDELRAGTPAKILRFLSAEKRRNQSYTGKQIRNGVRPQWRPFVYDALADMARADDAKVVCEHAGDTVSGSLWRLSLGS